MAFADPIFTNVTATQTASFFGAQSVPQRPSRVIRAGPAGMRQIIGRPGSGQSSYNPPFGLGHGGPAGPYYNQAYSRRELARARDGEIIRFYKRPCGTYVWYCLYFICSLA